MATVLTGPRTRPLGGTSSGESSDNEHSLPQEKGALATVTVDEIPPLGAPHDEKRFWFQRTRKYDPNGIATQVSLHHLHLVANAVTVD